MIREYRIRWHKRKIARLSAIIEARQNVLNQNDSVAFSIVSQQISDRGYLAELKENLRLLESGNE